MPRRRASGTTRSPVPAEGTDEHDALANELLNELAWQSARDRAGSFSAFKAWHRGSLSLVHLNVVALLEAEGRVSMSRLADLLDVSVASATGIVGRMEQRGYVRREHDTADRRVVLVDLTETGRRVFDELAEARRERLAPVIAELTVQEIAGFLAGLRAMKAARLRVCGASSPSTGAEVTTGSPENGGTGHETGHRTDARTRSRSS